MHDRRRQPRLGEREWFDFPADIRHMLQTIGSEIYRQHRLRAVEAKPMRARLRLVKKKSA